MNLLFFLTLLGVKKLRSTLKCWREKLFCVFFTRLTQRNIRESHKCRRNWRSRYQFFWERVKNRIILPLFIYPKRWSRQVRFGLLFIVVGIIYVLAAAISAMVLFSWGNGNVPRAWTFLECEYTSWDNASHGMCPSSPNMKESSWPTAMGAVVIYRRGNSNLYYFVADDHCIVL